MIFARNKIKILTAAILSTLLITLGSPPVFAYSNNNMIDDGIFDDFNSMNESAIRSFIQERPGTCLESKGAIYPEPKNYFDYGPELVDPARVIYVTAQFYGINPQVILSTLQKEQSLLTDNDCFDGGGNERTNKAMGYGCFEGPGAECPLPQYAGFEKQVMKGGWQLKFNKERAIGNITWEGDPGDQLLTYSGPFTEGNRQTSINSSSVYYDGYWLIDGQSTYIETGGTASLYSYTPHLNQSFPGIFETYFGPTTADYFASDYYRYKHHTVFRGETVTAELWFKNTASNTWYDKVGVASAPPGTREVRLYTSRDVGRNSVFSDTWPASNMVTREFDEVYESDGTTLAADQHVVEPNQIAKYEVTFTVPENATFKKYREYFQPSVFQKPNWFNDPSSFIDITVVQKRYISEDYYRYKHQNAFKGDSKAGEVWYKNVGNVPWYDNTGVASAPPDTPQVRLYTGRNVGRQSIFGANWSGMNMVSKNFDAVYESDGTTLAADQHVALPSQIVKYDIDFEVPTSASYKKYREYFQPSVFQKPNKFNDPGSFLDVTVKQRKWRSSDYYRYQHQTANPGDTVFGEVWFENTGDRTWYDQTGAAAASERKVMLYTSHPIANSSLLGGAWGSGKNVPGRNFSAVYESDGTTLAADQHKVDPGQIAKYDITFEVPSNAPAGKIRTFFQPSLFQIPAAFNDPWSFLDVDVVIP